MKLALSAIAVLLFAPSMTLAGEGAFGDLPGTDSAFTAPAPAPATAEPVPGEFPALSDFMTLKKAGRLQNMARLIEDAGPGALENFLSRTAAKRQDRLREWTELERILSGSNGSSRQHPDPDPSGAAMRELLLRVKPEDWNFVIRISQERLNIVGEQGPGSFVHNVTDGEESKCRTRAKRMYNASARQLKKFPGWKVTMLADPETGSPFPLPAQANHNKINEHSANCYFYLGEKGRVELIADSWADFLVPAELWFDTFDPEFSARLKGGGEYCGEAYMQAARPRYELWFPSFTPQ